MHFILCTLYPILILMDNLDKLIEIFAHFPGIGPRQAKRFAYYLLGKPQSFIREFSSLVLDVKNSASQCSQCQRLFIGGTSAPRSTLVCHICSDTSRDATSLMIVARDSDFESIEKSGAYKGLYFILGGTVPILDKEPEKRIRLRTLLERVSRTGQTLHEVILSLNTTPDGEHTEEIVHEAINRLLKGGANDQKLSPVKITILGRGLSTGAELEYVDSETIRGALQNRH